MPLKPSSAKPRDIHAYISPVIDNIMFPSATYFHCWMVLLLLAFQCLTVGDTCPTNCSCVHYHYVSCVGQAFSTIPDNIPTDTTTLRLAYNELVLLDLRLLYTLDRLRVLDVRANEIVIIQGSFEKFPFLREVYLGQNNLTTISQESFGDTFQKLAYIDLTENPFDCQCGSAHKCSEDGEMATCDILWLKSQIHQNIDRVGRDVLCQNPYEVRDQFIDDVNISESKCALLANFGDNLGDDTTNLSLIGRDVMIASVFAFLFVVYCIFLIGKIRYMKHSGDRSGQINNPSTPKDDTDDRYHKPHGVAQQIKDEAELATVETKSGDLHDNETHSATVTVDGIQSCSASSSLSDILAAASSMVNVPFGEKHTTDVTIETVPADVFAVTLDKNVPITGKKTNFLPDENRLRQSYRYRSRSFDT